jgi:hypothetical protein
MKEYLFLFWTSRILGTHSYGYEELYFWDIIPCTPLKVDPTFRRNMSPPSSSSSQSISYYLLHAGFLLLLFLCLEKGGDTFLRNVGRLLLRSYIPEDRNLKLLKRLLKQYILGYAVDWNPRWQCSVKMYSGPTEPEKNWFRRGGGQNINFWKVSVT